MHNDAIFCGVFISCVVVIFFSKIITFIIFWTQFCALSLYLLITSLDVKAVLVMETTTVVG